MLAPCDGTALCRGSGADTKPLLLLLMAPAMSPSPWWRHVPSTQWVWPWLDPCWRVIPLLALLWDWFLLGSDIEGLALSCKR